MSKSPTRREHAQATTTNTVPRTGITEYETPWWFVRELESRYGKFDLDPCATQQNAKAPTFLTPSDDGLSTLWGEQSVFMNPPYGREISEWVEKAVSESKRCQVVGLLPGGSRDTAWWHEHCLGQAHEIVDIKGRIPFELDGIPQKGSSVVNVVVVWREGEPPPTPIYGHPIVLNDIKP